MLQWSGIYFKAATRFRVEFQAMYEQFCLFCDANKKTKVGRINFWQILSQMHKENIGKRKMGHNVLNVFYNKDGVTEADYRGYGR